MNNKLRKLEIDYVMKGKHNLRKIDKILKEMNNGKNNNMP